MVFTALKALKTRLLENEGLSEGYMFYEDAEYQYMKLDDSKVGWFYIREYGDRFGDSMTLERIKMRGCSDTYKSTGSYFVVLTLDSCYILSKAISILLYQLGQEGIVVKGLGTDSRSIFQIENGQDLTSAFPHHLIKFTIEVMDILENIEECEGQTICKESCC